MTTARALRMAFLLKVLPRLTPRVIPRPGEVNTWYPATSTGSYPALRRVTLTGMAHYDDLGWIKSSYSFANQNCLEWRTSSHSMSNGQCVEVADGPLIQVRDSKNPDGPVLALSPGEWAAFTAAIKAGEFC
jgi:Domain of unknown function (DUF397)